MIGEGAFARSGLSSVQLPKTLKEIKKETFRECKYLRGEDITIAAGSVSSQIHCFHIGVGKTLVAYVSNLFRQAAHTVLPLLDDIQ